MLRAEAFCGLRPEAFCGLLEMPAAPFGLDVLLHAVVQEHHAALGAGDGTAHGDDAQLGINLDHVQVQDGDLLVAHLTGAVAALVDVAGGGAGAQGTLMTVDRAAAVGHALDGGAVALNNALEAVALADAGDVHAVARGKDVGLQLVAHLVLGAVLQSELLQDLLELGQTCLLLMADLRLGELALGNSLITQLNGLIAILLGGLLLHHSAGAGLDHGHGDHAASFIEDLGHADLLPMIAFSMLDFPPIKVIGRESYPLSWYCSRDLTRPPQNAADCGTTKG